MNENTKTKTTEETIPENPEPSDPGGYSPPTKPSVTNPQNPAGAPQTAAATGPQPPEVTGQPQPTPEEIETRRKAGDPSLGEAPFRDAMRAAGRGKEYDAATRPHKTGADAKDEDLEDMTVPELKDLAAQRGVEVHSDMLKDDIIKAIKKKK